ncbi:hypothetical protein AAG906_014148 [Vitis piasezkii]
MVSEHSFPTRSETSSNSMSLSVDFTPPPEPTGSNSASPFLSLLSTLPHLARLFAIKSRAQIMQLKEDLTLIQRGSRTVSEFLHAVKVIVDELSLIDAPVSDDDLTLYVLNGLGSEFRDMVAPIRTRETTLSFAKLHDLLIGHEHYLKRMDGNSSTLVVTTNSSQRKSLNPRFKNNKNHSKQNSSNKTPSKKSSVVCQICDHPISTSCQLHYFSAPSNGKWLLDSAASHNITFDLANLFIHFEYDGQDDVVLGNGTDLFWLHMALAILPLPRILPAKWHYRTSPSTYLPYCANKFQLKSQPCVFLGYSLTQHVFQCLDIHMGKLYLSLHVTFDENIFPFTKATTSAPTVATTPCPTHSSPSPVHPVCMVPSDDISVTPIAPDATETLTSSPTPDMTSSSPTSFINQSHPHHVCSLQKSIYGLKQAPRAWYNELRSGLLELGFFNSKSDSSLFIFNRDGILLYVLVYVDDLILTGNNSQFLQHVIKSLGERFSLKELNDLHYFLGVEVIPVQQGLYLSYNRYVHDLLTRLKMVGAKGVQTPMYVSANLMLDDGSTNCDAIEYRRTIGSLQYLSISQSIVLLSSCTNRRSRTSNMLNGSCAMSNRPFTSVSYCVINQTQCLRASPMLTRVVILMIESLPRLI